VSRDIGASPGMESPFMYKRREPQWCCTTDSPEISCRGAIPLHVLTSLPRVTHRAIVSTGHRQSCSGIAGNAAQSSAIVPSCWPPSRCFRILPASCTHRKGREERYSWEESGSHGSARVITVFANHLEPECHSTGDGLALADHSPASAVGRVARRARQAIAPCGGAAGIDGHDVGSAPTTANGVLG